MLEKFVTVCKSHVKGRLLEPHVGAKLGHPAEQGHSHQFINLRLPREVVHAQPAIEFLAQHFFIEVLIELLFLNFEFFLSQGLVHEKLGLDQLLLLKVKHAPPNRLLLPDRNLPRDGSLRLLCGLEAHILNIILARSCSDCRLRIVGGQT